MADRKNFLLLAAPTLFLACNLPQAAGAPVSPFTASPTAALQTPTAALPDHGSPQPGETPAAPADTPPGRNLPSLSAPRVKIPTLFESETVDDFFARCPTADEIAAAKGDITLTFEADPTAGTLVCRESEGSADLTSLQKRAYQSVLIMKYLTFDAPLPWTEKNLYDWFAGLITAIRFRSDIQYSFCCEPANAINILAAGNSYLMLTDRWIDPAIGGGLMDTMVLYAHEARHNEGRPHTCNGGQDDKTIAEMGAWGVQYYLLQWLAQHGERAFLRAAGGDPDLYRRTALADMLMIRRSRFCDEPAPTPGPTPTLAE